MCGIVGLVPNPKDKSAFNRELIQEYALKLSLANYKRGEHSAGIARISKFGLVQIYKQPRPIWVLAFDKKFTNLTKPTENTACILIHTRQASIGGVNLENAHPHIAGDFVAVHNGTVVNHRDFYQSSSDSIAMLRMISDYGFTSLRLLRGESAMIIVDRKNPSEPYVWVSGDRPLHVVQDKRGNVIYSSEAGHLRVLLDLSQSDDSVKSINQNIIVQYLHSKGKLEIIQKDIGLKYTGKATHMNGATYYDDYLMGFGRAGYHQRDTKHVLKNNLVQCSVCSSRKDELQLYEANSEDIFSKETIRQTAWFCKVCAALQSKKNQTKCGNCNETLSNSQYAPVWFGIKMCNECYRFKSEHRFTGHSKRVFDDDSIDTERVYLTRDKKTKETANQTLKNLCLYCGKDAYTKPSTLPFFVETNECYTCRRSRSSATDKIQDNLVLSMTPDLLEEEPSK